MEKLLDLFTDINGVEVWENDGVYWVESFDENNLSLGVETLTKEELIARIVKEGDK